MPIGDIEGFVTWPCFPKHHYRKGEVANRLVLCLIQKTQAQETNGLLEYEDGKNIHLSLFSLGRKSYLMRNSLWINCVSTRNGVFVFIILSQSVLKPVLQFRRAFGHTWFKAALLKTSL